MWMPVNWCILIAYTLKLLQFHCQRTMTTALTIWINFCYHDYPVVSMSYTCPNLVRVCLLICSYLFKCMSLCVTDKIWTCLGLLIAFQWHRVCLCATSLEQVCCVCLCVCAIVLRCDLCSNTCSNMCVWLWPMYMHVSDCVWLQWQNRCVCVCNMCATLHMYMCVCVHMYLLQINRRRESKWERERGGEWRGEGKERVSEREGVRE